MSRLEDRLHLTGMNSTRRAGRMASTALTATFLLRDAAITIGSFTLAPYCASLIPDSAVPFPHSTLINTQMVVPALPPGGFSITPAWLDLDNRPYKLGWSSRAAEIKQDLSATMLIRCIRIVPAFGFGCHTNMRLRSLMMWLDRIDSIGSSSSVTFQIFLFCLLVLLSSIV